MKISKRNISIRFILAVFLTVTLPLQASTLAEKLVNMSENSTQQASFKSADQIDIHLREFVDSTGLRYIGGEVKKSQVARYLHQLKTILGNEFEHFRGGQKQRDHSKFHITLVNPFEFKALTSQQKETLLNEHNSIFSFKLLGLGKVTKNEASAYFVVAESERAQTLRVKYNLPVKDFHVTLGFSPNDVHGVRKDRSTLIK